MYGAIQRHLIARSTMHDRSSQLRGVGSGVGPCPATLPRQYDRATNSAIGTTRIRASFRNQTAGRDTGSDLHSQVHALSRSAAVDVRSLVAHQWRCPQAWAGQLRSYYQARRLHKPQDRAGQIGTEQRVMAIEAMSRTLSVPTATDANQFDRFRSSRQVLVPS